MSKVKHLETRIVTLFGIEDEEGNIVQQFLLQANPEDKEDALVIRRLKLEDFEKALNAIINVRGALSSKHDSE